MIFPVGDEILCRVNLEQIHMK